MPEGENAEFCAAVGEVVCTGRGKAVRCSTRGDENDSRSDRVLVRDDLQSDVGSSSTGFGREILSFSRISSGENSSHPGDQDRCLVSALLWVSAVLRTGSGEEPCFDAGDDALGEPGFVLLSSAICSVLLGPPGVVNLVAGRSNLANRAAALFSRLFATLFVFVKNLNRSAMHTVST